MRIRMMADGRVLEGTAKQIAEEAKTALRSLPGVYNVEDKQKEKKS